MTRKRRSLGVRDVIALSSDQPHRKRLSQWYEAVNKPLASFLPLKVGDCLRQLYGTFKGRVAQIQGITDWFVYTDSGDIALSQISGDSAVWAIVWCNEIRRSLQAKSRMCATKRIQRNRNATKFPYDRFPP